MNYLILAKTSGILGPVAEVLGWILDGIFRFTSSFGVMNIGLCIILFTLVIKLIMFPLTLKQQKSTKLMAVMQPEIQAIQKKYKGKTDNDSMMKMNVETKAVYEKYGTSMTGGCVQLIIQMPILFALYRVIYNIPSYVTSVKAYFDPIVSNIQSKPDFINSLSGIASEIKMPIDKFDYNIAENLVDLLYKLNKTQWNSVSAIFPDITSLQANGRNAVESIHRMQNFLGFNISYTPMAVLKDFFIDGNIGGFGITAVIIAIAIPVLAGASQWYTTKLMSSNQPTAADDNSTAAQSMKTMTTMMPLMSVFFCFTFAAGIGIYWIATSVVTIIQQVAVNKYLEKVDIDEMVRKNLEKANEKRAKKGLPPASVGKNASATLKNIEEKEKKEEKILAEKIEKNKELVKESSEYYNKNAKPGSLASKAAMVAKYNEKHNK